MIVLLRLVPTFLSGILMGAHFLRWGNLPLFLLCLLFPFAVLLRHRLARRAVQLLLLFGASMWVMTTLKLTSFRISTGDDWVRMAVILGSVSLFHLLAIALLQGQRMNGWFSGWKRSEAA